MKFSSRSIELIVLKKFLNYSVEENPCCIFFPGAFNIKLVNSFILVWHSDYELSIKTQKPFFILKESSKCHNTNYWAKNRVVLFCFGLQSIARFMTWTRPTSTHIGWRVKENFFWNFLISVRKKWKCYSPA